MQHLDPKEIYLKVLDIHIKKLNELSATKQYPILLSRSEQNIFRQALRCIKKTGDFDKIVEVFLPSARYGYNWCQYAFFQCWDSIPKDQLYKLTLDVYFVDGFNFPKEAIAYIKELRPTYYLCDFPHEYADCDWLTVYRASTTPLF